MIGDPDPGKIGTDIWIPAECLPIAGVADCVDDRVQAAGQLG